jgi:hypothetical protein
MSYPEGMTKEHVGKRVMPFRKCMNQPTTICETSTGERLWVMNDGLKRDLPAKPAVGVGMFWCGCGGAHEDHEVNDKSVLRMLSHVLAIQMDAIKAEEHQAGYGFQQDGFLYDRAPDESYRDGLEQARRMRQHPCTGFFCTEAQVAAYCQEKGWLEFNETVTGSRITKAGMNEQTRLLAKAEKSVKVRAKAGA